MSLVVEDGTGLPNAESYVSVADCQTYATARGLNFVTGTLAEQALRRATSWIDATYRNRFSGIRLNLRAQALEWPRFGVIDLSGVYIPIGPLPIELVKATCEAGIRELASPGCLSPDLERGGYMRSRQAGGSKIEYDQGAPANTVYQLIDGILAPLIATVCLYTATAGRG